MSPEQGLFFVAQNRVEDMKAYCDSDWASCSVTQKSITSYCIILGDATVSWSIGMTVAEVIWIRSLLDELGTSLSTPTRLYCDNKAVIQIAGNPNLISFVRKLMKK